MTTTLNTKLRILNTRPQAQAEKIRQCLSSKPSYENINLPLLEIVPIDIKQWQTKCLIEKPDILIFISSNAVHHSIKYLKQCWQQMPQIAAIGSATNLALQTYNINAAIIPNESNSTSLINHPLLQTITNKSIVIIKGKGGRQILQNYIKSKQAKLKELNVYHRKCPINLTAQIKQVWQQAPIDLILIYSIESMTNLLNNAPPDLILMIKNTSWLVISERIQQQALDTGIKKVKVFSNLEQALDG